MNATDNPYSILGVSQDADDETIKKAYRKAAMLNHPDKQTSEEDRKLATSKFAKIADAYALLNDPVRRYDWRQANQSSSRSSSSQRPPMSKTRPANKSPASSPQQARRSSSFGPGRSPRSSDSSVCSTSTRSSTRSSSSAGRRKSRASLGRYTSSPQPSMQGTRRASSNLPVRESAREPIRRTASLGANVPTVRSPMKPKRPSRNSSFNNLPTPSTKSKKSNPIPAEKGRKKSRTPPGTAAPMQGRRLRRVA